MPYDVRHPIVSMCIFSLLHNLLKVVSSYFLQLLCNINQRSTDILLSDIMTITSFFCTVSLLSYVHVHVSVSHKLVTVKYTCLDEINLHTPLKPISYDGGVSLPYMDFPLRHVCVVIQNPLPLAASPVKSTNICVHKHVIIFV